MKERPSSGERVVFCTRADCAFRGADIPTSAKEILSLGDGPWYECEADIVVMDRRVRAGKTCGRFAKRAGGTKTEGPLPGDMHG